MENLVSPLIWPLPDELASAVKEAVEAYDMEKIQTLADQFPPSMFLGVLLGWTLGALIGAAFTTLLAGRKSRVPGLVAGGKLLCEVEVAVDLPKDGGTHNINIPKTKQGPSNTQKPPDI